MACSVQASEPRAAEGPQLCRGGGDGGWGQTWEGGMLRLSREMHLAVSELFQGAI